MNNLIKSLQRKDTFPKRRRVNWNQRLENPAIEKSLVDRVPKSTQYILLLKKFDEKIDYKNVKLLQAFLTPYGKILSRRKTRLSTQKHRQISKSIRKARAYGLIPFTCDVKIV